MVQVPDSFKPAKPCIITAPSSGSRDVYGAIGTAGQWGLSHGCAVAYTDKGTGTGFYIGDDKQGYDIEGQRVLAQRQPRLLAPHRIASQHAHSGHNVEKDWGKFVLQSLQFAFFILNKHHRIDPTYTRSNTLVIASSISNGGASSLKAAEQDKDGWIDAVVVAEPNIELPTGLALPVYDSHGLLPAPKPLLDIATYFAIYQGCASLVEGLSKAPLANALTPAIRQSLGYRCLALKKLKLLQGEDIKSLALAAQEKILDYGVLPEALQLGPLSTLLQLWESVAVTYASAYGRYRAENPICGISFALSDALGKPSQMTKAFLAKLPTISSGIPPVAGIELINDSADNTALRFTLANGENDEDRALQKMLCLRKAFLSKEVQQGLGETTFSGDLHGKPTIIVHGRHDALIHVNHSSRPYLGLNRQQEGAASHLHYYEVSHGQHFDSLLGLPSFAANYIPLHFYFDQAMEKMWDHLTRGTALPPSQVIYAQPAYPLPPIAAQPGKATIRYNGTQILIP